MYDWLQLHTGFDAEFLKTIVAPIVTAILSPCLVWLGLRIKSGVASWGKHRARVRELRRRQAILDVLHEALGPTPPRKA